MKQIQLKRWLAAAAILILLALLLCALNRLLLPKYRSGNTEGRLTADYYTDVKTRHQVLFLGDCEVYESFTPPTLWEEYGISSYIRGNAQQLVWQSYYLLEDTLRYETPEVVVFNVYALKYGTPQNEAYNRMTLDSMKFSPVKLSAIRASITEEESFASYLFPLLRFHSRWKELTQDDFTYLFDSSPVSHNGYLMKTGVEPMTSSRAGSPLTDYSLPVSSMEYLEKMRLLCLKNGIELILVKSPTNSWGYWWYDEWDAQINDYAAKNGLSYYNFIPEAEKIGLDFTTDTYDAGVHLNVSGAEKLTSYFGKILRENHGLEDLRFDSGLSAVWQEKVVRYQQEKEGLLK